MAYIKNINPASGLPGQIADSNPYSLNTLNNTEGTLKIPFGAAMKLDAASGGYKLPAAAGDITNTMSVAIIGTRGLNSSYVNGVLTVGEVDGVSPGNSVTGAHQGVIYVTVEEAVQIGQACFIRFASGTGGTQLGAFRASADTATAGAHPNWYYLSSAPASGVAQVRVV
jgi:hypothetical protein